MTVANLSPSITPARIAVIGAGVSGLVAARDLARAGYAVEVFESEGAAGGRLAVRELAGQRIDIGAEAFATRGGVVAEYLTELGLADEIIAPAALGSWVIAGARGAADEVTAVRLPTAGVLGIPARPLSREAMRAIGIPGALRAAIEPLLPRNRGRDADTLGALVRARLGSKVLDRVVRPVALGVYSADPDALPISAVPGLADAYARSGSLLAAARQLRQAQSAAGGAVAGLRGGMGTLIDSLIEDLDPELVRVHTAAVVQRVTPAADGSWTVQRQSVAGAGENTAGFAGVLLAVPEATAIALTGPTAVPPEPHTVEVIALALDAPQLDAAPRGTGALVAAGGPVRAKALTHVTAKWPHRRVQHQIVRLSYGRAGAPPLTAGLNDAEVQRIALADASLILGIPLQPDRVRGMARQPWHAGGKLRAPQGCEPTPRFVAVPGLVPAGDWVSGTGLASVIPGARQAAREMIAATSSQTTARIEPNRIGPKDQS